MKSNPPECAPFSRRFLNLVLEGLKLLGIALAALLLVAIALFVSIKSGITIPSRWFGFCFWTGLLLWFVYRRTKRHGRNTKFWLAFGGLLALHVAAFVVVLWAVPDLRLAWFPVVFLVGASIMAVFLETFNGKWTSRTHPDPPSTA